MDQTAFTRALLDPTAPAPSGLHGPGSPKAGKRFDVYRNNVAVGLTEALRTAFPVIRKLVGDAFFDAMAGVFLRQHPPTSPLMMHYGAEMPSFLEGFPPAASLPYLADIARLELALRRAYHAADCTALEGETLAGLAPDVLAATRFPLAPAVQVLFSPYPILSIWRANTLGGRPGTGPEAVLVTRPGFDPMLDEISQDDAAVVRALPAAPLAEALQAGGPGYDAGPLLALLIKRGALCPPKTKD